MPYTKEYLRLFETYKQQPKLVSSLSDEQLSVLDKQVLYRKRLKGYLRQLRNDVRQEIARRVSQRLDEKKARELYNKLTYRFHMIEIFWKDIIDGPDGRATGKLKLYQRQFGLCMNDMTVIPTGIYTVNALINSYNKCNHLNTNEHFCSLYTHAASEVIFKALAKGVTFDIPDFAKLLYTNIRTVKTTKLENNLLLSYHIRHAMVDPQTSYEEAGVSPLVFVQPVSTRVKRAWHMVLEDLNVNYENIPLPFTRVLTLDEAKERYPELQNK